MPPHPTRTQNPRPGTWTDEPHPSSGSLSNNSFSLTRVYCVPVPLYFAYQLLRILQNGYNYLHVRAGETVLTEINNLLKVTHLAGGETNLKPGPLTPKCRLSHHAMWPLLVRGMEGYSLAIHFTPPQVYQKYLGSRSESSWRCWTNREHWLPFVLRLKITFTYFPKHN